MEPILNEHEVIKFLVDKGGRCTNFELVSNFRGVLNDPHCKAEARLRFKDIINTVATVGEFQNVKYIELKKEHGLNNGVDSPQPSSLNSDYSGSSYSSPLTQSFQPYWRYRLSTSKQLAPPREHTSSPPRSVPTYHRSVSLTHPQGYTTVPDDQMVPCQSGSYHSGDFPSVSDEWESGQMSQSLPFYSTRGRASSEPRPTTGDQRRYSSDGVGLKQIGQRDVGLQQAGYQYPAHQASSYQQQQLGDQNTGQDGIPHHAGYQYPTQQYPGYQQNQFGDQSIGQHHQPPVYQQQLYRDQRAGYQDTRVQQAGYQSLDHQPPAYQQQLSGEDIRLGYQYSDHWNASYDQQAFGDRPLSQQPVGFQPQHLKQEHIRRQLEDEQHSRQKQTGKRHVGHQNIRSLDPTETRPQRSNSGRRSGDFIRESHEDVSRNKPESSFSRRIESLHGIHPNEPTRGYSSLPYESPSSYHSSDISPQGATDLATGDLQTSANLRNVARALFRDPIKSSSRNEPHPQNIPKIEDAKSDIIGLPNVQTQNHRLNTHSSPHQVGYVDDTNMYFSPGRQGYRPVVVSGANRNESSSSHSSPNRSGYTAHVPFSYDRQGSMDSNVSERSRVTENHSSPNQTDLTTSQAGPSDQKIASPRSSSTTSPRNLQTLTDSRRQSSSDRKSVSSNSSSMLSLDSCDKEPSISSKGRDSTEIERGASTPQPLPPDRRKKPPTPPTDDKSDDNSVLESCSGGKVKDRVQHFDDMEKRRTSKRTHSPLSVPANKENRTHQRGMGIEDDISISVIEPKLKREWFVKAAQCDYHALSGLLKKEPKLAALKDTAMGYTALHWAAKQGDANVVKLIAGAYKVNPNIRSNGGYTPVHLATLYKHEMIVHLLVHTYGADASIRDYSGKRADQYPENYAKVVAGHQVAERRPLKQRPTEPQPKEPSVGNSFMRIGSLNLRKSSRKSTVFASVRGSTRNWGSASELRLGGHSSMRKKLHKSMISAPEKIGELEKKNDSDSDSNYGFTSKKQDN